MYIAALRCYTVGVVLGPVLARGQTSAATAGDAVWAHVYGGYYEAQVTAC